MKYSMMTYTLMRQKGYTPADCVQWAKKLGMEGIDWVSTYGEDPALLRKMSEDAGLVVAAHTFFIRKDDIPRVESVAARSLDDACTLGAPVVMVVPMPMGFTEPEKNRLVWTDLLKRIAPLAAERNLVLTVENFPGSASPFVTASDFYEVKKVVPSLKLTFDNGNAFTGEDPIESLKRCAADIAHVHLKDWLRSETALGGYRQMTDGFYYKPALIGEGVVDSRATVKALEEVGYDGFVNIEYEGDDVPAHEGVRRVLEYLRGM